MAHLQQRAGAWEAQGDPFAMRLRLCLLNDPAELTAVEAVAAIARGTLTCEALARACLDRIAARERIVHAWREIDPEPILARARALDRTRGRAPLRGVPVAIKDIIDTADFPTRYGSPIYADHRPAANARCVDRLIAAGALIAGKTVTTEFAYYTPGPTANPHDPRHTPGGSSSGSAAAVADHMVPVALGTQTAGSIIRPASFCGIVGFKPTFGRLSVAGIKPFAPGLDTLGCFARSVEDAELIRCVLDGDDYRPLETAGLRPRIGVYRSADWDRAEPASQKALLDVVARLMRVADVVDVAPLADANVLAEAHRTIMAFESGEALGHEYRVHREALSPILAQWLGDATHIDRNAYAAAQSVAAHARAALGTLLDAHDVLLTPAAVGEAPEGLGSTGDPAFNRVWTMLGVPAVTIPAGVGARGLPIGIQLIGRWAGDRQLLATAAWIQSRIARA